MILVTLGTHPQPMNRLLGPLVDIAITMPALGPFIGQLGTTPQPAAWVTDRFVPADILRGYIRDADIVITHGGPATIAESRANGKIPIVVPRRRDRREHVDDHQLHYCRRLAEANEILLIEDESALANTVRAYWSLVARLPPPMRHDPTDAIAALRQVIEELVSEGGGGLRS